MAAYQALPADGGAASGRDRSGPSAGPSDSLLEDLALHFSITVYHRTSTWRIGSVVDPRFRVVG